MARGFIAGILIGGVFSVVVAGVVSFLIPVGPALEQAEVGPDSALGTDRDVADPVVPVKPVKPAEPVSAVEPAASERAAEPVSPAVSVAPAAPSGDTAPPENSTDPEEITTQVAETVQNEVVAAIANGINASQEAPDAPVPPLAALTQELMSDDLGEKTAVRSSKVAPQGNMVAPQGTVAVAPDTAMQPQVTAPRVLAGVSRNIELTTPSIAPEANLPAIASDVPVLPNPMALAPMEPSAPDAVAIRTKPAAPALSPEATPQVTVDAPAADGAIAGDNDVLPAPTVAPDPADTQGRPTIGAPASITSHRDTGVKVNRLPTALSAETAAAVAPEASASGGGAIKRYSQPFANADDKPLMGILLMDTGSDLDGGEVGIAALRSFPYPISFAVDASLPDATERMRIYRDEGFEVLAMVDLPAGAQPSDAETTLGVAFNHMPEVVGVLEGNRTGLQPNREVADQVTAILEQGGYGLVTQDKGLNTMPKLAVKNGVPAAAIFRDFDNKDQTPTVIRRFLDQAAFKAGIEGSVIMLGRMRPETISALLVWGLQDRASQVALAPISAVLRSQTTE
tara:strand:- start:1622 stop:3325 length:1704 start_codon:yes stop_codon:yes gene_type:complete